MAPAPGISLRSVCKGSISRAGAEVRALKDMTLDCPPGSFTARSGRRAATGSTAPCASRLALN